VAPKVIRLARSNTGNKGRELILGRTFGQHQRVRMLPAASRCRPCVVDPVRHQVSRDVRCGVEGSQLPDGTLWSTGGVDPLAAFVVRPKLGRGSHSSDATLAISTSCTWRAGCNRAA
jgi:hypothetical protein